MSTKNYEITMDLGYVPLTLNFTNGKEPVTIMFNPSDTDIARRLFEAQKMIQDKIKIMEGIELNENGFPIAEEYIEKANEVNETVYKAIDYIFNSSVSDKIFMYSNPFAIINGKTYIEQFLEKITPFMRETMEKGQKQIQKNNKYLQKYTK